MAKAVKKLTLSSSRDIPFNKLVLSQANVRRVKAGQSIEELAEDIARRTLLQGLGVRPLLDADGAETGLYEVPAGGRRFRALELLVRQKRLAKTALIPCVVRDAATDILAEDDSLAENLQRAPLHPLDQFRAFQAIRDKGLSEQEIAAAFFVSPHVVKQRLRLASVSERLLAIYSEDGMTLDQLMAFTITDDHARQEQVWEAVSNSWSKEPHQIRRMLTERSVRASDRRALFVGLDAYEQAGGTVLRNLFQQDDGGWLDDAALLDRLVAEKLKQDADIIAAEGWKWIEVAVSLPYSHTYGLRRLDGVPVDLTPEEQAAADALRADSAEIETAYEGADELPDSVDERLGEIEAALAVFDSRPLRYDPAEITRAGAFVSLDAEGGLVVDRGHVRPEDEAPLADPESDGADADAGDGPTTPDVQRAVITIGGRPVAPEEDEDDVLKPLPERLLMELTAHRTLALRDALAGHPQVAMTALLFNLVGDTFRGPVSFGGCLEAAVRPVHLPFHMADLNDSPSAKAIAARQEEWRRDIPQDDQALWDWLAALDDASRLALLAHCVGAGINALVEKVDRYGGPGLSQHRLDRRLAEADRLAEAVGLDMTEAGWRPTVETYLGRVSKPRILDAVREAKGAQAVQLIDHLKKADMAREAERLLEGSGWLPEVLRMATDGVAPGSAAVGDDDAGSDALPDFLTAAAAAPAEDAEALHPMAAE